MTNYFDLLYGEEPKSTAFTVGIVTDDPQARENYARAARELEGENLSIFFAEDADELVSLLPDRRPWALIVDLEVGRGKLSGLTKSTETGLGLDLLHSIKHEWMPSPMPYIVVVTEREDGLTRSYARELGADYICGKRRPDAAEAAFLEHIANMRYTLRRYRKQ